VDSKLFIIISYDIIMILFVIIILIILTPYIVYNHFHIKSTNKRRLIKFKIRMKILRELYEEIVDISNKNNIKLFLTFGSLLGKIRENNLICYDFDLDFGVMSEDYEKIKNVFIKYFGNNDKYKIQIFNLLHYKSIKIIHKKTNLNADIDVFTIKNNYIKKLMPILDKNDIINYFVNNKKCIYDIPKEWILPLKKIKFLSRSIYVPNNPKEFLKCTYGEKFMDPDHNCDKNCDNCKKI